MVAWHDGDRTTAADTSQRVDTCGGSRNDRPVPFVRRRACALAQHLGPILQGSQATLCRMLSNLLARAKVIQVIHGWPPHRVSNWENWLPIFILAAPGLLISLVLTALFLHVLAGLEWSLAFLLGAILSPNDPVAVLGLFRQVKVHERLSIIIEGESLFNEGVAGSLYQTFLCHCLWSLSAG